MSVKGAVQSVQYDHPDRLGTRLITNSQDTAVTEQVTLPFGTGLDSESTGAINRRFTSYDRNPVTGLDYAVNRQYDPQQGRFTQVDPIGMQSISLEAPQTLNLYNYVGNDPVNRTDPSGLFWGKIARFFRKVGQIFSAVGAALSRVLNNRWVRIGVFILGFILPGLQAIQSILYNIVDLGLKIYNYVADFASQLQLWGSALQGKWKEFGVSVAIGAAGAAVSEILDPIVTGVRDALFDPNFDELADLFVGGWNGLKAGLKKFGENLSRSLKDIFVPFYGCCGGPGNPKDENDLYDPNVHAYDDTDEKYKLHDKEYRNRNKTPESIRDADFNLVKGLLISAPRVHLLDIAFAGRFGGRPGIGSVYKFLAINTFTASTVVRTARL